MSGGDEEAIDFKPFFDLVVGVLFILLILIAAQLFFAQWAPQTPQASAGRPDSAGARAQDERQPVVPRNVDSATAERIMLEAEANSFLDDLARRLRSRGFSPAIDRLNLAVSLPAEQLLTVSEGDRPWRARRNASEQFALALAAQVGCVADELPRAEDCPRESHVRLEGLTMRLLVTADAVPTPEPVVRVGALELASAVFAAEPRLLAVRSPRGALVTQAQLGVETAPAVSPARAARVEARFTFVRPLDPAARRP